MGEKMQNMEIRYHPEDRAGVTVVLHWGRYSLDSTRTIPVERWAEIGKLARLDLEAAAEEMLAVCGAAHVGDRATVVRGYARSLKALLAL